MRYLVSIPGSSSERLRLVSSPDGTQQLAKSSGTGAIVNNSALQDTYDFSLYRSTWTLGGLITLDFNTPFCN